jgi:hypothetical protein
MMNHFHGDRFIEVQEMLRRKFIAVGHTYPRGTQLGLGSIDDNVVWNDNSNYQDKL